MGRMNTAEDGIQIVIVRLSIPSDETNTPHPYEANPLRR